MVNDLDRLRQLAGTGPLQPTENVTGNMYELRNTLTEAAKPDFADIDGDGDKEEDMKDAAKDKEKTDEAYWPTVADNTPDYAPNNDATVSTSSHNDRVFRMAELRMEYRKLTGKRAPRDLELEDYEQMVAQAKEEAGITEDDFMDRYSRGADQIRKAIEKDMEKRKERMSKEKAEREKSNESEMRHLINIAEWANSPGNQYEDRGHYSEQPDGETVDLSLRRYLDATGQPVKVVEDHTEDGMLKEYKQFKEEKQLNELTPRQKAMKQGAITDPTNAGDRSSGHGYTKPTSSRVSRLERPTTSQARAQKMLKTTKGTKTAYDKGASASLNSVLQQRENRFKTFDRLKDKYGKEKAWQIMDRQRELARKNK